MLISFGRSRKCYAKALLCLVCAAFCVPTSQAQTETDGAIGGEITNAVSKPVAAAHITVRNIDTALTSETSSDRRGSFILSRLPVGEYRITIQTAHTDQQLLDPVTVSLSQVTDIAVQLQSQEEEPLADTTPSGGANELTAPQISVLPVDAGQWHSLALTFVGADPAAADGSAEVSFRGLAPVQNSARTDGTSADDSFSGSHIGAGVSAQSEAGDDIVDDPSAGVGSGSKSVASDGQRTGSAYVFADAGVREFRVQGYASAAAYGSALYGHGVGGELTTLSRSGTASLHATAFYTARNSAWAATNPFSIASTYNNGTIATSLVKPEVFLQQFGGSVGGPIASFHHPPSANADRHARLFFFYAFDRQMRNDPAISSPGYADFYSLTSTQTDLLANRGVSSSQTNAALNYLDSLTGTVSRSSIQSVNFLRLDWQRSRNRAVLEYNRARWSLPAGARSGAVVDRAVTSLGSSYGAADSGVVRWVQFLRFGVSNEVRAQYGHELRYQTPQRPLPQEPSIGPNGLPPEISIGPQGLVFGTPAALGQHAYPEERRLEAADNLLWVHGHHLLQFGGDFSAINDATDSLTNQEGTFSYDSGSTNGKAGGLVDWITDYTFGVNTYPNGACPSIYSTIHYFCFRSYSQSFGQQSIQFSTRQWAAFAQDDWKLTRRLVVHAGVRYEYESLPSPQHSNPVLDAVFGGVGTTSAFPADRNNFGPRIGLEWSPLGAGSTVIRAGYGLYFGKLPGATIRAALLDTAQPDSTTSIRILPTTETLCPQNLSVGFGYPCSFLVPPTGVAAATTSAMVFDRHFRLPMVQQGSVSIQQEFIGGVLGSARYVINLDRQLPDSVDINLAPSSGMKFFQLQGGTGAVGARDGETFVVPVYASRISANFGPVTDIVSHANASYNGFTLEAQRGLGSQRSSGSGAARSLDLRIAWTWSKAIDFGQNSGAVPRTNAQFDPFNIRYDKGLSALNFPHRVVATVVWSPRIAGAEANYAVTAQRTIWRLADGWSLAGIFTQASGRGYSYEIFGGTRLPGGRESINGAGGSTVLPTAGRNTLRLPESINLDLRLSRSFSLREDLRLRVSAEAFNVANHVNYSGVIQRAYEVGPAVDGVTPLIFQDAAAIATEGLNVQPFGTYTASSVNDSRERHLQFGVKLEF